MATELKDPAWQETQAAVLRAWEARGLVEPGWSVEYNDGDGAYRARFTLVAGAGLSSARRRYDLSELEWCTYVMALADLVPAVAGPEGVRLADESRLEAGET
ncbi:hypothetical protein ACFPC0_11075 [Streptomyces andamanensis]|uniref:Uncharacterized protein n=1 Tax=Streptomyces andamanensis TaxID=1565035 RepID=A0ABV8TCY5_9ACTN